MINLSVYFVTLNEEKRLPMALEKALMVADEIVVVDSGSIDRTCEIAKNAGARVIYNKWISIGHQVSFAEKRCSNRWVLRLDADEVLSDGLVGEILAVKNSPRYDGYKLRIGEVYPGIPEPCRWVKHYKLIRLYNRDAFQMSGTHGHDDVVPVKLGATVKTMRHFVKHYSFVGVGTLIEKRNIETDMQIERAVLEGKNYSPWRMVGTMVFNFIKYFFLHRQFLYGFWGFINSTSIGILRFLKFAKFYEQRQLGKYVYLGLEETIYWREE